MDRRTEYRIADSSPKSSAVPGNTNTARARVETAKRMVNRYIKGAPRYLTRIEAIEKRLLTANHLSSDQIRRLEIVANLNLKKLDKIVPDLKHFITSSDAGVPSVREKEQLIAEAKQLGLDVEKLFADYGVEERAVIEGEIEEDAVPDTQADEEAEAP